MSSHATAPVETDRAAEARRRLRSEKNPFAFSVVTAGSDDECAAYHVPELVESQLNDLREIVGWYRDGRPASRVYPVLGATGAGKSHLLNRLVAELHRTAVETGAESVVLAPTHIPTGLNGVDFLYRELVSHLLAADGPGLRALNAVAGRLTGRLLSEALGQLPPHKKIELVPAEGFFDRLRLRVGGGESAQKKLTAVLSFEAECGRLNLLPDQLRQSCLTAGVPAAAAIRVAGEHVARTESKDALGWVRQELYARLTTFALTEDRQPFEDLLTGEVEDLPPHLAAAPETDAAAATAAGVTTRVLDYYLLTVWVELLDSLKIPLVLVVDDIDEPLRRPTPELQVAAAKGFTQLLASIITRVPDVCIFILGESGIWFDLLERAELYTKERLAQFFTLVGRSATRFISLATSIDPLIAEKIVRRRVQGVCPDIDWTGLPMSFPFDPDGLAALVKEERTIRECLRSMARGYDEIILAPPIQPKKDQPDIPPVVPLPPPDLRALLDDRWKAAVASTRKEIGRDGIYTAAKVYDVQVALDGWLRLLADEGITGAGPWHSVELLHVEFRRQYGYLNLIRTDGPDAPGVGIAAWLAEGGATANDLRRRIEFFDDNPCPVRTLILLRRDGRDAIKATAKGHYDDAIAAGRDVRVHKFEPKHVHALFALDRWRQTVAPEVEPHGDGGRRVYLEKLTNLSAELLGWIDGWRRPEVKK